MASDGFPQGDAGVLCRRRRAGDCVFVLNTDGSFSYLSADGAMGWRNLALAAKVNGQVVRGQLARLETAAGDEWALLLHYPPSGLSEKATIRLLSQPPAMTVERVFTNAGTLPVAVEEVLTAPAGDGGVLFAGDSAAGLRCIHVGNLRECRRRNWRTNGPFVMPIPAHERLLGDSEGHHFPVLAIADGDLKTFLLEGSLQRDVFTQIWRIRGRFEGGGAGVLADYAAIARDGRSQPVTFPPGERRRLAWVFHQIKAGCGIDGLYDDYLAELGRHYDLRGKHSPLLNHAVYCTWNYAFFADISEQIIDRQAEFIAENLKGVRYFLIDDGYQDSANTPSYDLGKWYPDPDANVDRARFPRGMKAVAEMIRSHGLKPALWWSPALGRRNRLVAEHPEWLCLDERGESWSMDSGTHRKAALDFSVKEVRDFVEHCLDAIFVKWGYIGMKLDFCTYPFDCKDLRFRGGEGVRWWNWLLQTVARFIPADGFFQLCGGAPYGDPFVARWCDSHRVGGDIGMGQWQHHRAVSSAPLPLLAVPGRAAMLMDVDSAGVRKDMTDEENLSRLNWCFITGGVMGIGGDLAKLSPPQVAWLNRITERPDRGHKVHCPDRRAFLGEPLPEVLYVDYPPDSRTAKAGVVKHVAFFNWDDLPRTFGYSLEALGISPGQAVRDFWTGAPFAPREDQLIVPLKGRESRLLEVPGS